MKRYYYFLFVLVTMFLWSCNGNKDTGENGENNGQDSTEFKWVTEQFADLKIIRYQVPGWDELSLDMKKLCYYLSEAALSGREMIYDQNYRHNLCIKRSLENIYNTYNGDKSGKDWEAFHNYLKRIWFSNGIHHHYSSKKMIPEFSQEYFDQLVKGSDQKGFPLQEGETVETLIAKIKPVMFDENVDFKRVNKDKGVDLIKGSANNYYSEDITQAEVEAFYASKKDADPDRPVSWGLNSKLVRENGQLVEKTWKVGGMYSPAIEKIVYWLEKATEVAENDKQKTAIELLIKFYQTGDLAVFDEYSIAWVNDTDSDVDMINGFIEVYGDALGYRGAYESIIELRDPVATKRIAAISKEAQWFEDNSPIMDSHKKENVKGITAKVINVIMEAGDASPSTPIGVNLPNANWIRRDHGSKSVNLANIVNAYDEAGKSGGVLEEFAWDENEINLAKEHGALAGNLHTDMHEVIGHASGQINPGIGTPKETLKSYASTLEEGRADLVALYYLMDQKLVDMGVMPSLEVGKAEYNSYIRNGLMLQLRRLELGEDLEEDHMRNRQLVAGWVYEKGKADNVIEKKTRDGKTYFVINDYMKLRDLFGQLLREIQRIKSEGDYESAKELVEGYGVKVDQEIHKEVLERVEKLNIAPYSGFINPVFEPVMDDKGEITDIKIIYPDDFTKQHLDYSKKYSFLPAYN